MLFGHVAQLNMALVVAAFEFGNCLLGAFLGLSDRRAMQIGNAGGEALIAGASLADCRLG